MTIISLITHHSSGNSIYASEPMGTATLLPTPVAAMDEITTLLEERAASLRRLVTLLRLAEGAWVVAVFDSEPVRKQIMAELARRLQPLPCREISLLGRKPDLLAILQETATGAPDGEQEAPVICLNNVGSAFPQLFSYLDLQRETLAGQPQRLLFWMNEHEQRQLAERAPNFYSRLSNVFFFLSPAPMALPSSPVARGSLLQPTLTEHLNTNTSRRSPPNVRQEKERPLVIKRYQQKIHDLRQQRRPDWVAIGDAYYDLALLFKNALPRQWTEAEIEHREAARAYATAGRTLWQADMLYLAGDAALRSYAHQQALVHLQEALNLYRILHTRQAEAGEANVLTAQGDVLAFLDQREAALAKYEEALGLFRAVGARLGEANVLASNGQIALIDGNDEEAKRLLEQAIAIYQRVGSRYSIPAQIGNYGWALWRAGRKAQAKPYLQQAAELFTAMGLTDYAERHRRAAEEIKG
ncbi:MAG: tetratricopeptide repeat protein [Caldilineaceae bacterium]